MGYIQSHPVWMGMVVLGLCAMIEYLFPPFPGDTITVVGAVLIPTAGYPWWGVFLAVMLGSMLGAWANWWLGDWIARTPGRSSPFHRMMSWEKVAPTIDKIKTKFVQYGVIYVGVNRFVPAFRSLIFVSAGLAQLPAKRVMLWAAVSATAWNAALMGMGSIVGFQIEPLAAAVETYAKAILLCIAVYFLARFLWGKRAARS